MIEVPNAIKDMLKSGQLRIVWLVDMGAGFRYSTHDRSLVVDGVIYAAGNRLLTLSSFAKNKQVRLESYNFTLSDADGALYALMDGTELIGRDCSVYLLLLDDSGVPVTDGGVPFKLNMFKGSFDRWSLKDGGQNDVITVSITSPWAKPTQKSGRITSTDTQEQYYPGDKFFEFAHEERSNIGWGEEV